MCYHNFWHLLNTHKLRNWLLACTQTNCLYLAMFAKKTTFDYSSSSSSLFLSLGLNHKQWEAGQLKQEHNKQANKRTNKQLVMHYRRWFSLWFSGDQWCSKTDNACLRFANPPWSRAEKEGKIQKKNCGWFAFLLLY